MDYRQDILNYFLFHYIKVPEKINYKKVLKVKDLTFKTLIEDYTYKKCVHNCIDFFIYHAKKIKAKFSGEDLLEKLEEKLKQSPNTEN